MVMIIKKLILFCIVFATTFLSIVGQEVSQSFDSKGTVFVLSPKLASDLSLFKGDGNFQEARLFQENDSLIWLEISFEKAGKIFRSRKQISYTELLLLQHKVDSLNTTPKPVQLNQDGRGWMLAATTYAGVTLYGASLPIIFDLDSKAGVGTYLLTACSGFFIPYYLTKHSTVSYGQANMVYYGLSRGFLHGILLAATLDDNLNEKRVFGFGSVVGATEAIVGFNLVKKLNMGDGQANLLTVYGDIGIYTGLFLANQLKFSSASSVCGTTLLTSAAGLGFGYYLGKSGDYTAGDAELIKASFNLGAYLPIGLLIKTEPDDSRVITGTIFLSGIAGAYLGHQLINDQDFSFTQGFIIELGSIAGGLGGAGLGYMFNDDSPLWIHSWSALGALSAYTILYSYYKNKEDKKNAMENTLSFNVYPQNYYFNQKHNLLNPMPLFALTKRF
jgi:hypothetical protein